MALSTNTYIYAGGSQTFTVNFSLGFIQRSDVQVRINGAVDGAGDPAYATFDWIDDSNITVTDTLTTGDTILIERTVSKTELKVNFAANADVTPSNLDLSAKHGLMLYQELVDGRVEGVESPITAADRAVAAADVATASKDAAVISASEAAASAVLADADRVATNADVVLTNADKVATNADVVLTNADVVLAEADKVQTGLDRIATAADKVATNADVVLTNADVVLAEADKVQTGLDRIATAADVVSTAADVVLTNADVTATADKLPKSGGALTGPVTTNSTFDGRDVSVDGAKLDTITIDSTVQGYDVATAKTDVVQTYTASQRGAITALTDAASIATDMALSNNFSVTLAGNRTLANPTNVVAGQSGSIYITQDATGARTLAYGSLFKFVGGVVPVLSTTANAVGRIDYAVKSATEIHAVVSLDVK
jgi:hypothetical protein